MLMSCSGEGPPNTTAGLATGGDYRRSGVVIGELVLVEDDVPGCGMGAYPGDRLVVTVDDDDLRPLVRRDIGDAGEEGAPVGQPDDDEMRAGSRGTHAPRAVLVVLDGAEFD